MRSNTLAVLPLAFITVFAACTPRTIALNSTAALLDRGAPAFYEEPDAELAKDAMASQLLLLEELLKNDPNNHALLLLAGQGFGGYAFLFVEDSQPARARDLYLRGRDYSLAMLSRSSLKGLESMPLTSLQESLKTATPKDVPALFWAAYNWAGWINLSKDSPDAVAGLPKAAAIMRRVQELSPGYYHDGPDLFLGSYYSALPRMLGGDPAKAKLHFEAAIHSSGGHFLIAHVLYAKYYAVAVQDRQAFTDLNTQVIASTDTTPDTRLANAVAKIKAKHLLEKINELF